MNKALIKANEAQKCLNVLDCSWNFLFQNDFNLVKIYLNVFNDDDKI